MPELERFIWDNGVFETDNDPLYVFADYYMIFQMELVHTHRGYICDTNEVQVQEHRSFHIFDGDSKFMNSQVIPCVRDVEEGASGLDD
ncbi:MAG: hypothetical protein MK102_18245 [Fuerstiella sp.]|nr:hypothetical protein [Fuerstiella sp.]